MKKNAKYYLDGAEQLQGSLKTCKKENRACIKRAVKFGKDKFLELTLVVVIICSVFVTGCATIKGACQDTAWMLTEVSDNIDTTDH